MNVKVVRTNTPYPQASQKKLMELFGWVACFVQWLPIVATVACVRAILAILHVARIAALFHLAIPAAVVVSISGCILSKRVYWNHGGPL